MMSVGQREAESQRRVVEFFRDALGYTYLGHWKNRADNSNIEHDALAAWLTRQGHSDKIIEKVLFQLDRAAALSGSKTLYDANRAVYGLLRYGVKVRPGVGQQTITVWLVDWTNPEKNDFAIAEEVTISGEHVKRPDVVLYVNGIAWGVLELKRSIVSVTEGIRQNLDSQKKTFIRPFYTTSQLLMAGNETEGLRYGVIDTPEKYWLRWKENELPAVIQAAAGDNPLLRELGSVCRKDRLLEIVHDFMVFDAGIKKTCRHNQYFGVRAAQAYVERLEGGILWHTQGSGKSLMMVWLAKWIREHVPGGRVLILTDRTELDDQIEKVFHGVDEDIHRTRSGADLVNVLNANEEWLMASLIHKFDTSDEAGTKDIDAFVDDVKKSLPKGFTAKGTIFVFVDECHRTQSGKLHDAMRTVMPDATLIGFTGTPLLKSDKRRSVETFGPYIHTYKYDQAVQDGVVLDLRYEARDINQTVESQEKIDEWFDIKTSGLTNIAKAQLKKRWGTMQKVLSSRDRLERIVSDVIWDMATRDRLKSGHGNAILVCDSIYAACRTYEMFQDTDLGGKTAIVTSYKPSPADIKGEETGEGLTEKLRQYAIYRKMLAEHFDEPEDTAMYKVDRFEQDAKKRFIEQPGQMKLLIVVDKLLTGFDAPPATYLYIDKKMQDHGLFQAICRVNRLDGEDKEYGYIVDYQDLFRSLEASIKDYTGEAFEGYDTADVEGLLKDRLEQAKERLQEAREAVKALCEPVAPPRGTDEYLRYFCATESGNAQQLKDNEPKRVALYKHVATLIRAYANIANEMREASYTDTEADAIKTEVTHYEKVRGEVKLASRDYVDMKVFEPAMRHLLDTYIGAEASQQLSAFDDLTLVDLLLERGAGAVDSLPDGLKQSREAVASTIENNVRKLIIDESDVNPKYYDRMSELLDALIQKRKANALDYKAYLDQIAELAKQVKQPITGATYPAGIDAPPVQALFDNLDCDEALALAVDEAIRTTKQDGWRGHPIKLRMVRNAIHAALGVMSDKTDEILEIAKNQRAY